MSYVFALSDVIAINDTRTQILMHSRISCHFPFMEVSKAFGCSKATGSHLVCSGILGLEG